MTKPGNKFFDFIGRHIIPIIIVATVVLGLIIRFAGFDVESADYSDFLSLWWTKIKNEGLAHQIGNYNIPYQTIIYIFTKLSIQPLHAYKIISIIFDGVLAASAALLVKELDPNHSKLRSAATFSIVFCSITVIFNSAFWAQCDSMYTSFIILAIYFILKDRTILSFIMLGLSFAFKLQVIFIIPVFLFYYVSNRKFSLLHFFIIPAVDVLLCIPALLCGRNPLSIIKVYLTQMGYDKYINCSSANLYFILCNYADEHYREVFAAFAILLTFVILFVGFYVIIYKKIDLSNPRLFLLTAIWTVYTCLMFLPSMHERYTYLLDILLIVYCIIDLKRLWVPFAVYMVSFSLYNAYLFEFMSTKIIMLTFTIMYSYISYIFFRTMAENGVEPKNIPEPFKTKPVFSDSLGEKR